MTLYPSDNLSKLKDKLLGILVCIATNKDCMEGEDLTFIINEQILPAVEEYIKKL